MPDTSAPNPNGSVTPTPPENKWTLMFYIAGDSSLSASMISQLKELTDAGYQENTTVLVYFDPNCNGRNARIFEVNHYRKQYGWNHKDDPPRPNHKFSPKPTYIGDGEDPYVRNIGEDCHIQGLRQMPAAATLRYFLEYSRVYYPADNYMTFLMGHGVIVGNDSFLPDADDGSGISLKELGKLLKGFGAKVRNDGQEFHLVGFHSCSMNSIEVACELEGSARYMLGTQGSAFPGSWPYRQLLKKIFHAIHNFKDKPATPDNYPTPLVQRILAGLQDLSFYNSEDFWYAGFSADLGMCSLDKKQLDTLTKPLSVLTAALKKGLNDDTRQGMLLAHWESQSYWGENYTDLFDLCDRLQQYCGEESEVGKASAALKTALKTHPRHKDDDDVAECFKRPIAFSDFYGPSYQFSHGLSIYFPWSPPTASVMSNYENYAFTEASKGGGNGDPWHSFLTDYFIATQRPLAKNDGRKLEMPTQPTDALEPPNRVSWWDQLSDAELLAQGVPPPKGPTTTLAGDPNKPTATLAGNPNKPTATLAGNPNKPTATLAGNPNKPTATLAGNPNKPTATLAGNPNKPTATLAGNPNKPTATLAGNPNKPLVTMGIFGLTYIKNYSAPEDMFITSRPHRKKRDEDETPGGR